LYLQNFFFLFPYYILMNTQSLKQLEDLDQFNIHIDEQTLPKQLEVNKSIRGRLSTKLDPDGSRSGYGTASDKNQDISFYANNSNNINPVRTHMNAKIKFVGDTDNKEKSAMFAGAHVLMEGIQTSLGGGLLHDITKHADKVADNTLRLMSSSDELKKYKSSMLIDTEVEEGEEYTVSIPLFKLFGNIETLLPTASISAPLRITLNLNRDNKKLFYANGIDAADVYTVPFQVELSNVELCMDIVELQPTLTNQILTTIQSSKGMMIPYHTYFVDSRVIKTGSSFINENINMNLSNVITMTQKPFGASPAAEVHVKNYYQNLHFYDDSTMDEVSKYLVNFSSSQYFNYNSNTGQTGKALFALSLNDVVNTYESATPSSGGDYVQDLDEVNTLSVNFSRSAVNSPYIIDNGINARLLSSMCTVSCELGGALTTDKTLVSIVKHTRNLKFSNSTFELTN